MRKYFNNKSARKACKIYAMLEKNAKKRHLSFHTPGHKNGKWDITELSFSDNLACPRGCIAEAEGEIADILGATKSFLLTDGSTCGVLSILYAAKALGVRKLALCEASHKSVYNACVLLEITPLVYPQKIVDKIPFGYTMSELKSLFGKCIDEADALFFTHPDYYGNALSLSEMKAYCKQTGKLLLVDGAHGGHLHFDKTLYAGTYADLWVDGVHKSLPAFTQGAVVSANGQMAAEALQKAVDIFRSTSPSYPIMASVEYAVKYPENSVLQRAVRAFVGQEFIKERVFLREDWTKLCVRFGDNAFAAQQDFEKQGIYPEFCDGEIVMFYLSFATTNSAWKILKNALLKSLKKYPYKSTENITQRNPAPLVSQETQGKQREIERVEIERAIGRICAEPCGLFPPCTPLICIGDVVEKEQVERLQKADNVYGLREGKLAVFINEKEEQ